MKLVITGSHAVSHAVRVSRAQVITAYPITPQTSIVEKISEFCADGSLKAKYVMVESEHSAMASLIGSQATGARSFTATSSHGLALMHEMLHWALGARLPIVMVNVNRAMGTPWSIWVDHNDSLSQRDTGWLQVYVESGQEVLDSVIMAFKIAEQVNLPFMVCMDGFLISHTVEAVDIPDVEQVDKYLPPINMKVKLDTDNPVSIGNLTTPDYYYELRYKAQKAFEKALPLVNEEGKKFGDMFGRYYGTIEAVNCEDADVVLVAYSTFTSTARYAVARMRDQGKKVGLIKMRLFRPFPAEDVLNAIPENAKICVVDRNISFGSKGVFASEIMATLYRFGRTNKVYPFIAGLGGRDLTPEVFENMINKTYETEVGDENIIWEGVKL
jgi:pyruvate/2-oxoacid:ferredoxin oxidoreductase alpha subunit